MIELQFSSIEELEINPWPAIYHIEIKGLVFSVYFDPVKNSKCMNVFSPGYLDRNSYEHPYFQRMKWLDELEGSGLIITDPTLSLHRDIGIAWFQGSKKRFAIFDIAKIVERFRNYLTLKNENVLFFGSSAGGFASMMLAALMKGSCCVVNNPQTDIFEFREPFLSDMLNRCYSGLDYLDISNSYLPRFSVSEFMLVNRNIPKCIYLQNVSDKEHYEKHFLPFIGKIGEMSSGNDSLELSNLTVRLYKDEVAGHNPAVLKFIKPYIEVAQKELLIS
ncbi:hypothetical protein [uncultured Vibrio sp.]|uniref:hypothetical protein n=1 Tax=uncultured Vibrio sp. TaxID=114054 RepID=UPI000917EF88|nr:hypothetical protein [uncultured Vibrio sp.]OIQ25373.1 MAG: hypothetical protein BM561_06310 [Vibrio sp. MedPE-SWchi]